jgi:hypothetical protein
MPVPARCWPARDSCASGSPGRPSPTCRFKMSRVRAPSKTSDPRRKAPSRPRSRQDGPSRQRSRQDGPSRQRSRPRRRLDARNQRQSHRNRILAAAPPVRRRTAGQPPDLLARLKAAAAGQAAPPTCSTDRMWLLTGRSAVGAHSRWPASQALNATLTVVPPSWSVPASFSCSPALGQLSLWPCATCGRSLSRRVRARGPRGDRRRLRSYCVEHS